MTSNSAVEPRVSSIPDTPDNSNVIVECDPTVNQKELPTVDWPSEFKTMIKEEYKSRKINFKPKRVSKKSRIITFPGTKTVFANFSNQRRAISRFLHDQSKSFVDQVESEPNIVTIKTCPAYYMVKK